MFTPMPMSSSSSFHFLRASFHFVHLLDSTNNGNTRRVNRNVTNPIPGDLVIKRAN